MSLQLSQGENNVQMGFIKHRVDAHRVYLNKRPPGHQSHIRQRLNRASLCSLHPHAPDANLN